MHRLLEIQVNNAGLEKTLDQSVDIVMTTTGSRSESAGCRVAKHACKHTWASGRPGPARHGHGPARHDGYRAMEARRALRAVPHRPVGLAFSLGTGLWAIFHAVLAREARQK